MNSYPTGPLEQFAGPTTWQVLFWLMIALLRKLGLMPKDNDDDFAGLGRTESYAAAQQVSLAYISGLPISQMDKMQKTQRAVQIVAAFSQGTALVTV